MDEGWQKIVDEGLSAQLDSAKEMHLAFIYYQKRQKIKDIFRYYGTSQKKYLAELDKNRPLLVKMIDAIDQKRRAAEKEKSQKNNKTVGKEFVW